MHYNYSVLLSKVYPVIVCAPMHACAYVHACIRVCACVHTCVCVCVCCVCSTHICTMRVMCGVNILFSLFLSLQGDQ